MAQARQQLEESQNALISCYEANGMAGYVDVGIGGVVAFGWERNPDGSDPPGLRELAAAADEACAGIPQPEFWNAPIDQNAYERMLDTRRCLIAQGYAIPEPPSSEVWLEQDQASAWNPYSVLMDRSDPNRIEITNDELRELLDRCPQNGQGMFFIFE